MEEIGFPPEIAVTFQVQYLPAGSGNEPQNACWART